MLIKINYTKSFCFLFSLIFFASLSTISFCQSTDLDKKLGAENAELVEQQMGLYNDKVITEYVQSVGKRLVAELEDNPFDFQFHIADDPIPNAFALPGGYVYVTRGILSIITTEDELACVMGHEIIHVTQRHSIKQMRSSILPNMLELPGAIVGTVVDKDLGNLLNTPINTSNSLLMASYSRKHESESDKKGVTLAAKAGYDPNAMSAILERLSQAVELLTNQKEKKTYFDDHPFTPDRVSNIGKTTAKLSWKETIDNAADFPAPLNGMVFGYNPSKGLFIDQVFMHPELNFTITFPDGWETDNQPSTVMGMPPNRNAGIFVGLEDPSKTPEQLANEFEKQIADKHGQKPSRSEPRNVNNHKGYLITMEDNSDDEIMHIHILWLKMDGLLFKLIGLAPKELEPALQKTAQSLRSLSPADRKSILVHKMQIVKAKQNETAEELLKRSKNAVKNNIVWIINGIDEHTVFKTDQQVKVVQAEPYFK